MPLSALYRHNVNRFAPPKFRSRNRLRGISGALARDSTPAKAKRANTPIPNAAITTGSFQFLLDDSISAKTTPPSPRLASNAPVQSGFPAASGFRLSGTRQNVRISTMAETGKLMKKTQRHEACSINQPPRTGPIAAVIDVKPDQVPMARPRSFSANDALMIARLPGTSSAAPIPWIARARISPLMVSARPQAADAVAKTMAPIAYIRRRP